MPLALAFARSSLPRMLGLLALLAACCLPAAGCGSKSSGGASIGELKARARKQSSPDRQATALIYVARKQVAAGDTAGGEKTADEALDLLSPDGDANTMAAAFVDVAGFYAETGEKRKARKALGTAEKLATGITDPVRKAAVYAKAGSIFGDREQGLADPGSAKRLFGEAEKTAKEIDQRYRAEALAAVALGYTRGGIAKEAEAVVGQLLDLARSIDSARAKAEALAAAANVKAQVGEDEEAAKLLAEAAEAAKSVERTESRAYALLAVAEATLAAGDVPAAKSLLEAAYSAADKVGDPEQRRTVLEKVSRAIDSVKKRG